MTKCLKPLTDLEFHDFFLWKHLKWAENRFVGYWNLQMSLLQRCTDIEMMTTQTWFLRDNFFHWCFFYSRFIQRFSFLGPPWKRTRMNLQEFTVYAKRIIFRGLGRRLNCATKRRIWMCWKGGDYYCSQGNLFAVFYQEMIRNSNIENERYGTFESEWLIDKHGYNYSKYSISHQLQKKIKNSTIFCRSQLSSSNADPNKPYSTRCSKFLIFSVMMTDVQSCHITSDWSPESVCCTW